MGAANEVRTDRRYTSDHEWAKAEGGEILCGITPFAVDQLGDITLVSIDVRPGDTTVKGRAFGTVESVKTVSDLFAPVSGTVIRVNDGLADHPELLNEDCWGKGWMIAIQPTEDVDALMDHDAYARHLQASAEA
ncbi:MAG: glycine cleavage system protein GcvH [Polyangiaceae bacterium]|nr:glycine cleavage system protein GcvH [Polyangiaceae bacterium]